MDDSNDYYKTLATESTARQKIKGSVFLAIAVPIRDDADGDVKLNEWRKTYYDSTHIGWARRLSPPPDGRSRSDDDGEPRGTTGPPILQAIIAEDLWGVQIGVVRWYGGTKLGKGGLVRAYGGTAQEAVKSAKLKIIEVTETVQVTVPTHLMGIIYNIADKMNAHLSSPVFFQEGMELQIRIRASHSKVLVKELIEQTAAQAKVKILP